MVLLNIHGRDTILDAYSNSWMIVDDIWVVMNIVGLSQAKVIMGSNILKWFDSIWVLKLRLIGVNDLLFLT